MTSIMEGSYRFHEWRHGDLSSFAGTVDVISRTVSDWLFQNSDTHREGDHSNHGLPNEEDSYVARPMGSIPMVSLGVYVSTKNTGCRLCKGSRLGGSQPVE